MGLSGAKRLFAANVMGIRSFGGDKEVITALLAHK
jgi:hypothetical protein